MRRRKKELLSEEDLALWRKVADSVNRRIVDPTPLDETATDTSDGEANTDGTRAEPGRAKPKTTKRATPESSKRQTARSPKPPPPPSNQFDAALARKLARRSDAIDATLDLHGMRQAEAHRALARFLSQSQARGHRLVAVITGKGRSGASGAGWDNSVPGVLRRSVPHWLDLPEFRGMVVGYKTSPRLQGGEGVIYIQLRRRR
ncbi:MAG: Smr/MutS family protein [Pseudomonadota bacterium]